MDATRRDTNPYVRDVSWAKGRGKGEERGGGNNVGGKRGCALFWVCFFPIFPFFESSLFLPETEYCIIIIISSLLQIPPGLNLSSSRT